eukprot:1161858-Pelagomonas_calceolata.AAC.6
MRGVDDTAIKPTQTLRSAWDSLSCDECMQGKEGNIACVSVCVQGYPQGCTSASNKQNHNPQCSVVLCDEPRTSSNFTRILSHFRRAVCRTSTLICDMQPAKSSEGHYSGT